MEPATLTKISQRQIKECCERTWLPIVWRLSDMQKYSFRMIMDALSFQGTHPLAPLAPYGNCAIDSGTPCNRPWGFQGHSYKRLGWLGAPRMGPCFPKASSLPGSPRLSHGSSSSLGTRNCPFASHGVSCACLI